MRFVWMMDGHKKGGWPKTVICENVVTLSVEENDPLPSIHRMMGR
jgi:hypothetical protein